jgi:hypothetical protein
MGRIGFGVAVAAITYALAGSFLSGLAYTAFDDASPYYIGYLAALGSVAVVGFVTSRMLFTEEQPQPTWLHAALLATASLYLLLQIVPTLLSLQLGGARIVLWDIARIALAAAAILLMRFVPRSLALFLGIGALALQFRIGTVLGLAALTAPKWLGPALTLGGAALIAFWMARSEASPAARVRRPAFLWAFGAAGMLTLLYSANFELVPQILGRGFFSRTGVWSLLAWLAFLGIFLALASHTEPQDADISSQSPRAGGGTLLAVLAGLYVFIGLVFQLVAQIAGVLEETSLLPAIACAAIAIGIMLRMRLAARIPAHVPGRGLLIAGLLSFAIAFLGGWRIAAEAGAVGREGPLLQLVFFALLVAPLVAIGTTLVGVGMLRVMFNLDPMPVRRSARTARAKVPAASRPGGAARARAID